MRSEFINTKEEMDWLIEVHELGDLKISWTPRSAQIFGQPDSPEFIHLYPRRHPDVWDTPLVGTLGPNGYEFCGPLQREEAMAIDAQEREMEEAE